MLFLFGGERGPVTFPAFKVLLSTLHVTAPGRSTAKIAFVYTAFRDSVHAAPRTTAKQNEKPTDTTTDTTLRCKANQCDNLAE
jgi:hypothetical protein